MTLDPGTQIGPYRVEALLGQGGMAAVYRVWHNDLHRYEALKMPLSSNLDDEFAERFLREARNAALQHPHIAAIHSVSTVGTERYFTMELIEGGDLADLIYRRGRLSLGETGAILLQVASALDFAHSRGVVHRDIKPSNILLQPTLNAQFAKVVDFGISKAVEDNGGTRLTQTGMFIGTPEYMSPEQAGSGAVVDHHTDQYSLGIIAYEMLCGAPPFKAESNTSMLSVIIKLVRDEPLAPNLLEPSLPDATNDAILKVLAKVPEKRFDTCSEFVTALMEAATVQAPLTSIPSAYAVPELETTYGKPISSFPLIDKPEIGDKNVRPQEHNGSVTNIADPTLVGTLPPEIPPLSEITRMDNAPSDNIKVTRAGSDKNAIPATKRDLVSRDETTADTPAPTLTGTLPPPQTHPEKPGDSRRNSFILLRNLSLAVAGIGVVIILMAIRIRPQSSVAPTPPASKPPVKPTPSITQSKPPIPPKRIRSHKDFPADKSRYWGDLLNGKMDGEGTKKWLDGSTFKGHFINDAIKGEGTLSWHGTHHQDNSWTNQKVKKILAGWKAQASKKAAEQRNQHTNQQRKRPIVSKKSRVRAKNNHGTHPSMSQTSSPGLPPLIKQ